MVPLAPLDNFTIFLVEPLLASTFTIIDRINGEVVIPPGGCISIQATSATSVLTSYTWKEVTI